jgi:hypothetical protein
LNTEKPKPQKQTAAPASSRQKEFCGQRVVSHGSVVGEEERRRTEQTAAGNDTDKQEERAASDTGTRR